MCISLCANTDSKTEEWDLGSADIYGTLFMFTCLKGAAEPHKAFHNIKFVFCVPI